MALLLLGLGLAPPTFCQTAYDGDAEQQLLSLINQARRAQGLAEFQLDNRLTQAARAHSQLMAEHKTLSHQFEGEAALPLRLGNENVRSDRDAENIALNTDIEGAHTTLLQSPPHRANLLNPQFDSIGVGVVPSGEVFYVTEDFAHVQPNYTPAEADAEAERAIADYAKFQGQPAPRRKPKPDLHKMACAMAEHDELDGKTPSSLPGVQATVVWNATDPGDLPAKLKKQLAQPMLSGYSLGACFAPSVSHPGGLYWLVFVAYD